jgi:hypothetical protein
MIANLRNRLAEALRKLAAIVEGGGGGEPKEPL